MWLSKDMDLKNQPIFEEVGKEGRQGQVAPSFSRYRGLPASRSLLLCH